MNDCDSAKVAFVRAARVARAYMAIADSCKRDGMRVRYELEKALGEAVREKEAVEVERATWIQVSAGVILLALLLFIFK